MSVVNGAVPAQFLSTIAPSIQAELNTAAAFKRLQAAHPEVHTNGAASGYWPRELDVDIHSHPTAYNISASEAKKLSPIGSSPHGLGYRLNFSGCTEAVAAQFGFRAFNTYTFDYTGALSYNAPQGNRHVPRITNIRFSPSVDSEIIGKLDGGSAFEAIGYTDQGQSVGGTPIWYGLARGWISASVVTEGTNVNGLPNLTIAAPPAPVAPTDPTSPTSDAPTDTPTTTPTAPSTPVSPTPPPAPVTKPKAPIVTKPSKAQIAADVAQLQNDSDQLNASVTGAPLAGLFAGHTKGRKRAYASYAALSLIVSFGPDLVTYGVVTGAHVPILVSWIGLSTSVLLKIGAAFGFVAAANTKD